MFTVLSLVTSLSWQGKTRRICLRNHFNERHWHLHDSLSLRLTRVLNRSYSDIAEDVSHAVLLTMQPEIGLCMIAFGQILINRMLNRILLLS